MNIQYQAPELNFNYFKINEYNHYKCIVYSLGLMILYIALNKGVPIKLRRNESKLNPETSLQGPNDNVIRAQLDAILDLYNDKKLNSVLELALQYNINQRPDFIELYKFC